jgi:uncharacterized repeat protein (TIGR01451 family)
VDSDADVEVVLNTAHSGVVVYDLPGTAEARLLWPTGRGSYLRSGSAVIGSLAGSTFSVSKTAAEPGETLIYTIVLNNPSMTLPTVILTDTLPVGLTFSGGLSATAGTPSYDNGVVTWSGAVSSGAPVTITFNATIDPGLSAPTAIWNIVQIDDGTGNLLLKRALTFVNAEKTFLPFLRQQYTGLSWSKE